MKKSQPTFLLVLLVGTIVLVVKMLWPYVGILVLAAVLAFLFSGIFNRLVRAVGNRSLAAFMTSIILVITVLVPLSLASYKVVQEAITLYNYLHSEASSGHLASSIELISSKLRVWFPTLTLQPTDIAQYTQQALGWIIGAITPVFTGTLHVIIDVAFLMLFFFYLVRDGARLHQRLVKLSPLPDRQDEHIIGHIGQSIAATVRGQMVLAIIQGLVAGIGFALFGIPNPALWGGILMLASFIPTLGATSVQICAIAYLLLSGHFGFAVALSAWAVIAVGLLDNILGPKLMTVGTHTHPLAVLLGVLGGLALFGPIGIIMGPIIMSLLYALIDIYANASPSKGTRS